MIEINFLDANGVKIISLTTIEEVQAFFKQPAGWSSFQALLLDLMTKHNRFILNGNEYYCHKTNIDNVSGKITVNYDMV